MGVGGQRHAPAALLPGKWAGMHSMGGWVGPKPHLALVFLPPPRIQTSNFVFSIPYGSCPVNTWIFISRNHKMYQILYLIVERYNLNFRTYRLWCVVISVYEVSAAGSVCRRGRSRYLLTRNTHRTGQGPSRIEDKVRCFMQRIN